jgi:3-oxoadipate enol-lactonase
MPSVVVGGTELHYVRAGAGEPLLLIQGLSATHLSWGRPFLAELEQSFDCIAYDNRGMGLSGEAEIPFSVADLATDALGLLDGLEVESAHVLGISLGGMIAQELALAQPERIRTLTLGCTYCGGPDGKLPEAEVMEAIGAALASGERERVYRAMWETMAPPGFREEEGRFEEFREMAMALPAPRAVILEQLRAGGAHDASERLGELSMPTLVVHGTADRIFAASNGQQIAFLIPARLELMEGVGHLFWWEQPERSASLIREHALAPA